MTEAERIILSRNPNACVGLDDDGLVSGIEDITDPDQRLYRVEYRATPDGRHAIAFCRHNPWGRPNGGESYESGHVAANGFLCLGTEHENQEVESSPYPLDWVIGRVRYWCTGFSVLKETGEFPQP